MKRKEGIIIIMDSLRKVETIKIILTACTCVVTAGILYEYIVMAKEEKKMLQDVTKLLEELKNDREG